MAEKDDLPIYKKSYAEIIKKYDILIKIMAKKYCRNRIEHDDVIQEGMVGLCLAIRDFDDTRSKDFHTYCITRIKSKMYEYCISNSTPIYIPTHVAKAASYVEKMSKLLNNRAPNFIGNRDINDIISVRKHNLEEKLSPIIKENLDHLKQRLENIASNSKMSYENLARLAMSSLSLVVSDDILTKHPKENGTIDEIVSNKELGDKLKESLGEKRFIVLSYHFAGCSNTEIADKLFDAGYTNKDGKTISRQAVKGILDETLKAIRRMGIFNQ